MGDTKTTPVFPPELERDIFEIAARLHPGTAVVFALVSRRVQLWMESYIYDTVTLATTSICHRFLYAVEVRSSSFFTETVKSLCIPGDIKPDDVQPILKVCRGVVNLAYWINIPSAHYSPFSIVSPLRPVQLSINTGGLFGREIPPNFTHPFFERVTHLEIVDWPWEAGSSASSGFELLPSLTHLALDVDGYDESIINQLRSLLEACQRLRVLLCLARTEEDMINTAHAFAELDKDDDRIVILSDSDVVENWQGSLTENPDTCQWIYAESIVVGKRNSKT
ncbi:hypothetical protein FPV67DRAFT_1665300 [Lyophyllum atratum]|nr:hypothetical protein FPV67DRAFT_1665300 [Lyophyllum atratum]